MRIFLLILLSTICFTASAQWYRVDLKLKDLTAKKQVRPEAIEPPANHALARFPKAPVNKNAVSPELLARSEYSLEVIETEVMKTAKHNMRFRVYNDASYNFSELARMYIQQNRYAEAKWFLLQSNSISRDENDDKHTIANLIDLATIKSGLGDYIQARQDLTEAHELASIRGFKDDVSLTDKKLLYLKQNQLNMQKVEVRYAEAPLNTVKAE
ncbi:MAG: hypothetical protein JWP45_1179 [Mucilaginibacter sp.]|nr:hypothetical protein [Mucilaginibacter sp.]